MEEKPQNEKTQQLKYFIDNKIINSNSSRSISEHYLQKIQFKLRIIYFYLKIFGTKNILKM